MFFQKQINLLYFSILSIIIIFLLFFINTTTTNLIATVLVSIIASVIVSIYYNKELHDSMDKYNKIGLVNYFDNFEDAQDEIRKKIEKAKKVDIYVMYADRFLNTSYRALTNLVGNENTELRCFIYSKSNQFIDAYCKHWTEEFSESEYDKTGVISKLENVKKLILNLNTEKNHRSTIELFEIQTAPISYSFYRIDDELYFVPHKNIRSKKIKPAVFHFKKTKNETAMFSKIEAELNQMISSKEVIKQDI